MDSLINNKNPNLRNPRNLRGKIERISQLADPAENQLADHLLGMDSLIK